MRYHHLFFAAGLATAAATLAAARPALATSNVVAQWSMDESAASTVMYDQSGHGIDGAIGAIVEPGVASDTGAAYRFLTGSQEAPSRLVLVADDARLDPGSADLRMTVRLRSSTRGDYNVLQKGQARTKGGHYKFELHYGVPACQFGGSRGRGYVAWRSSISDGSWHSVTCSKSASRIGISVDDAASVTKGVTIGTIANSKPLSIGGKAYCRPASGVDCDYFSGDLDRAQVSVG